MRILQRGSGFLCVLSSAGFVVPLEAHIGRSHPPGSLLLGLPCCAEEPICGWEVMEVSEWAHGAHSLTNQARLSGQLPGVERVIALPWPQLSSVQVPACPWPATQCVAFPAHLACRFAMTSQTWESFCSSWAPCCSCGPTLCGEHPPSQLGFNGGARPCSALLQAASGRLRTHLQ